MNWTRRCLCSMMLIAVLTGCNPYKPTGNVQGPIIGAAAGGGIMALTHSAKTWIAAGAAFGGLAGYYATTLTYDAAGVQRTGGKVFQVGEMTGIYLPADELFVVNTDEFMPQASAILNSVAAILARQPNNNILISGNTSGFNKRKWEQRLSLRRAEKVTAYLWQMGMSAFQDQSLQTRKLQYVGYGDYFPIASTVTNRGIRENSRIQITSYPDGCTLNLQKDEAVTFNVGALDDNLPRDQRRCYKGDC